MSGGGWDGRGRCLEWERAVDAGEVVARRNEIGAGGAGGEGPGTFASGPSQSREPTQRRAVSAVGDARREDRPATFASSARTESVQRRA